MQQIESRLYVAAQVRELDRRAIEQHGIPGYTLMQRAAAACWREALAAFSRPQRVAVVCGGGNNGGDGYEIARLARADGCEVRVFAVGNDAAQGDAVTARSAWLADGGSIDRFGGSLPAADWVVDALFGTGLSRAPSGAGAAAIAAIRQCRLDSARVVAVDVPSGLDASNGNVPGDAVDADLSVTFIGNKLGLWTGRGPALAGARRFDALQVPPAVHEGLDPAALLLHTAGARALGTRARDAHKGRYGHVLVVGGNHGMAGAALLAGRAALRSGAGLVSVATRADHAAALTAAQPELMVHGVADPAQLDVLMARASIVALGPGLGQDQWARALFAHVVSAGVPLVVDADALNLLARLPRRREDWILTPHPGEAARLLQSEVPVVQADRLDAARQLQARYGGAVALKGAGTVIAVPADGPALLCPFGNPGMAVGGSGDALTGVIAAMRAQGLELGQAAATGVLVHALAGDRAAQRGERGMLPSDLIGALRAVINPTAGGGSGHGGV
ncbi:MAG: NAD(P)H-hydrate dehydratase [Nevskiales bacterium]|nr:NAD(P)H-hydrate dehydratase [Nevskiales bacterium]